MRRLAVSVDIDSLSHYLALYGHAATGPVAARLTARTYELGIRRFLALFDRMGIPATFFTVGKDLQVKAAADVLREAKTHEIANHSWSHPYDLIHQDGAAQRAEVTRCHEIIEKKLGVSPKGFRAPGYNTSPRLLAILKDMGYAYDASPLPSWPYLAAKYTVIGALRLLGRRSSSIFGDPTMGTSPIQPYETNGLSRIPCAVTRATRLPIIGTTLTTLPAPMRAYLIRDAAAQPIVSLEFHAVDLMDRHTDLLPDAFKAQKDLNIPWKTKKERIHHALTHLLTTHDPVKLIDL